MVSMDGTTEAGCASVIRCWDAQPVTATQAASATDLGRIPSSKLSATKKTQIARSATAAAFSVEAYVGSVCEENGYRRALDCDVLFSCVDRPWGRSVLNYIAYAHLIPVIDGGLLVSKTKQGKLRSADWKAHVVGPSHRCLLCLDQYDPALVEADRRGDLE